VVGCAPAQRGLVAGIVLVCTGAFFLVPLFAALRFSLENFTGGLTLSAFTAIPSQLGFTAALSLSSASPR